MNAQKFQDVLLLPPRVIVGSVIAIQFGVPKLSSFSSFAAQVAQSGTPMPTVVAVGVTVVEVVGGFALALGLGTRLCGAALFLTMLAIALVPRHESFPWDLTPFMLGGYIYAVIGPGRWSLDYWIFSRRITPDGTARKELA